MATVKEILANALKVRRAYVAKKYVRPPHKPYSRAKGKDHFKQANGFKPIREPVLHVNQVHTEKTVREPNAIELAKDKVAATKHGARNAYNQARGRNLTIEAGVRIAKRELQELRVVMGKKKRRK